MDTQDPFWPENDGINILGTPLGSPKFVEEYLQKKLGKHEQLLDFITVVARMGFAREAHKMLTGAAVPRLTHILKSVPKDEASKGWMQAVDDAHLSTWLECAGASTLDADLSLQEHNLLSASLDLPPQFGGIGMQSLIRAADEEYLGSWAAVTANLTSFLRARGLDVYDKMANAMDSMADEVVPSAENDDLAPGEAETDATVRNIPAITSLLAVSARTHSFLADIS